MELKRGLLVLVAASLLVLTAIEVSLALSDRLSIRSIELPEGSRPVSICYGGGKMWVLDAGRRSVVAVNPDTSDTEEFPMPERVGVHGLTVNLTGFKPRQLVWAEGKLWIAGIGLENTILLFFDTEGRSWGIIPPPWPWTTVGGWCLAYGDGSIWTLVDVMGSALLLRVDPATGSVEVVCNGLPGGSSICYGAGSVWVLYTFVVMTPFGVVETSRIYRVDVRDRNFTLFTSRSGSSGKLFLRDRYLYFAYTPASGSVTILKFDVITGGFMGQYRGVPGVLSPVSALFVDGRGDVWFSQPGYMGISGKRIWEGPTAYSFCEIPGGEEIWACCEEGGRGRIIVVSRSGLAGLICTNFPSYLLGLPSQFVMPLLSSLAALALYVFADFVVGRIRYKRWLRERGRGR